MRWKSRDELQTELVRYAAKKLTLFFDPAPDEDWRANVLAYFTELDEFDREVREALRLYDRSKARARKVFEKRGIPISFEFESFERMPPTARVLLLALVDGVKKIGPCLLEMKRTRTSVAWLMPAFTTRGFVVSAFESCAIVRPQAPVREISWGPDPAAERGQLTDIQLALIHTFVFRQQTMEVIPPRNLDRTLGQYVEDERRRVKKVREHFAEQIKSTVRAEQNGARFVLPNFR